MAFLDYKCPSCGKEFSELVKRFDDPVHCPQCKTLCERSYSGQVVGGLGKKPSSCTGNCKNCSGCR
ncbi:MAG: zinc ribbon domain-containing protein [Clostridia bacterium]|nr:zinc ribbon domain-containing protein [Clostridia bacterium]